MRGNVLLARAPAPPEPHGLRLERCHGVAEIGFATRDAEAVTYVAALYQKVPCRVLFPRVETGDPLTAVMVTTSGGITGGDTLKLGIRAGAGSRATATTQAAEKVYRSLGPDCTIDVALEVGAGAWLEWLPQETILFDRARLVRRNVAEIARGGRLMALEMLVFGREAHGERLAGGRLLDSWRVRYDGKLVWADGLRLDDGRGGDLAAVIDRRAGFDGARAIATVIYVAEDAADRLDLARGLLDGAEGRAGATVVGPVLVTRFLGRDVLALRRDVVGFVGRLRAAVAALPQHLPRVWSV